MHRSIPPDDLVEKSLPPQQGRRMQMKTVYSIGLIAIIVIATLFVMFPLLTQHSILQEGLTTGILPPNGEVSYQIQLEEPSSIHIGLSFPAGVDFDVYLYDADQNLIGASTNWLNLGEYLSILNPKLIPGRYTVVLRSFSGSGEYTLFYLASVETLVLPTFPFTISNTSSYVSTLQPNVASYYYGIAVPATIECQIAIDSLPDSAEVVLIDVYGDELINTNGNTSLILNISDYYQFNIWPKSNLYFLKLSGVDPLDNSVVFTLTFNNLTSIYRDLSLLSSYSGKTLDYKYDYEYRVEVQANTNLTYLRDAVPLIDNCSPYLDTSLTRVFIKETGANITSLQRLSGGDGLSWIGFELFELDPGNYTIVFQYEMHDYSHIWNLILPNANLTTIPSQVRDIWTRPEGFDNYLEIPSNSSYFKELAMNLTSSSPNLASKIQALFAYVVRTITYNAATTPVSSVINTTRIFGNCHCYATLLITLLRAIGIPAREAAGLGVIRISSINYNTEYHGWVEIYYPDYGWIPVDPTWVDTVGADIGPTDPVTTNWYESFHITGSHIRLTYWLQLNGTVWWSYGTQVNYFGSPYPAAWFTLNLEGTVLPSIFRGFEVTAYS